MSWNIVSRSLREALPLTPSCSSVMNGLAEATFPVKVLRKSTRLNLPRPPAVTRFTAVLAGMKSASLASEVPGAESLEKNLVGFQIRGLENNFDAVREFPLCDFGIPCRRLH